VCDLLQETLLQGADELEEVPEDERDPVLANPHYQTLLKLNELKRRIEKVLPVYTYIRYANGGVG
jgi:hypothetical protein